jgi:hypothetical protein
LLNGQTTMVVMTVCVVYPLSCQKHMRSLEAAAGAGRARGRGGGRGGQPRAVLHPLICRCSIQVSLMICAALDGCSVYSQAAALSFCIVMVAVSSLSEGLE